MFEPPKGSLRTADRSPAGPQSSEHIDNALFNELLNSLAQEHQRLMNIVIAENRNLRATMGEHRRRQSEKGATSEEAPVSAQAPILPNEIVPPISEPKLMNVNAEDYMPARAASTGSQGGNPRQSLLSPVPTTPSKPAREGSTQDVKPLAAWGFEDKQKPPGPSKRASISSESVEVDSQGNEARVSTMSGANARGSLLSVGTRNSTTSITSNHRSASARFNSFLAPHRSSKPKMSIEAASAAAARMGISNRKLSKVLPHRSSCLSADPPAKSASGISWGHCEDTYFASEENQDEFLLHQIWVHKPLAFQRSQTITTLIDHAKSGPMTLAHTASDGGLPGSACGSAQVSLFAARENPNSMLGVSSMGPSSQADGSWWIQSLAEKFKLRKSEVKAAQAAQHQDGHEGHQGKGFHRSTTLTLDARRPGLLAILMYYANCEAIAVWDIFGLLMVFWDIIWLPIQVFDPPETDFVMVMSLTTLVFWTLDFLLSFCRSYFKDGLPVGEFHLCAKNYLKTWFAPDILLLSTDWFMLFFVSGKSDAGNQGVTRTLRVLRVIRTIRLARLFKIKRVINQIQDRMNSEWTAIIANLIALVFLLLVANHFIACIWFLIGKSGHGLDAENWVSAHGFYDAAVDYQYATAMHWSLTQFTPASMSVQPCNTVERIFAIIVIVIALICFSSFLSSITTSMTKLRGMKEYDRQQFWLLRKYLQDSGVTQELGARIIRYLEYACSNQRSHVQEAEIKLLSLLSEQLHNELRSATSVPHVCAHPLHAEMHARSDVTMHRVAARAIDRTCLANGDALFYTGEIGTLMFFVCDGELQYLKGDLPEWVSLQDWICESALWTPWVHLGDLMAMTETEVLSLECTAFSRAVLLSPKVWEFVAGYAKRYVEALNELPEERLTDTKAMDEFISPQEIVSNLKTHNSLSSPKIELHRANSKGVFGQVNIVIRNLLSGSRGY